MTSKVLKNIGDNKINNYKLIRHGKWDFEYNPKSNIFISDTESFDNNIFKRTDSDIFNKKTDNSNNLTEKDLEDFRRAALIHKVARKKALSMLCAGNKIADLVDSVENIIIKLCQQDTNTYFLKGSTEDRNSGIAFPVGVNINNVVAHDSKTVSIPDTRKFYVGDVVKIDIGVHVNGRIIDSAFTHIITDKAGVHDEKNIYNSVLNASRESVFNTIKLSGPEQRLDELSEYIDEIIQSYEVDIGGDLLPIKSVAGIGGHNIKKYKIHGGKLILSRPDYEVQGNQKMEDGEVYAIETYATTGYGIMTQNDDLIKCTHYMSADHNDINNNKNITKKDKKIFRKTDLYKWMDTRKGLPFSSSWIIGKIPKLEKAFKNGIPSGQVIAYPPLYDEENSVVAQFEHTIHVKDGAVEIFSLGDDY